MVADGTILTVMVLTYASLRVARDCERCNLAITPRVTKATHTLVAVDAILTAGTVLTDVRLTFVSVHRTVLAVETWSTVTPGGRNERCFEA